MSRYYKNMAAYNSPQKLNEAFIETFMRIQKACKTSQELSKSIEQYFKNKTKFKFSIARLFEPFE